MTNMDVRNSKWPHNIRNINIKLCWKIAWSWSAKRPIWKLLRMYGLSLSETSPINYFENKNWRFSLEFSELKEENIDYSAPNMSDYVPKWMFHLYS